MFNRPLNPNFLCCDLSEQMNEPMVGTAVGAGVWFLLEYTRPWAAKATEQNELPLAVSQWLGQRVQQNNGRLQLIRQFRPDADVWTFYVGVNQEIAPRLYEFHLGGYEDLLDLDVTAIIAGANRFDPHLVTGQRYFVCTNGKRDRSCAVRGAALYRALTKRVGTAVWQTTHLGGHRFAATLLSLPDGVCYGRVAPEESDRLLTAASQAEVWLEKLRGRTCYGPIEQIADYYLRRETGQTRLDGFRWVETLAMDGGRAADGRWRATFHGKDGHTYHITLAATEPLLIYANSGQLKTKEAPQYRLIDKRIA